MSADNWTTRNWTICPECRFKKETAATEARLEVEKLYGKVTFDEFSSLINNTLNKKNEEQEKTLRENYEIGIDEFGSFSIDYQASCNECQFKYKYEYVTRIY